MKIIQLKSENFKRLKAIEITPRSNTVIVSGKNGQGKTSILDSIFVALAGKQTDLVKPIRDGEAKADIMLETEKYFIHRIFKQGSTKLEVTSKDGEIVSRPQDFLDSIIGKLSFDPLEFQNLKEKVQRDMLLKLANIDLEKLNKKRKDLYDERHDVGVLRDGMSIPMFDEIAQAEALVKKGKFDTVDMMNQIQEAQQQRSDFLTARRQVDQNSKRWNEIQKQIIELQRESEILATATEDLLKIQDTSFDLTTAQLQISSAGDHNSAVDAANAILTTVARRKRLDAQYDEYTAKIESLDAEKQSKLETAKFPIDGLSVSDDGVLYNKIPFFQLSSAEKLKVSMAIAMAANPELRVIRILDGSLLDEDNMKVISQMAGEKDFQVWIEKVDSSGKVGFYIEDGEIVSNN